MPFMDKLKDVKVDQLKQRAEQGLEKAKGFEQKTQAGEKAKVGFGKMRDAAKEKFGKK